MNPLRLLPIFLIIATIENFSTDIILPSFPAMQTALHVGTEAVELSLSCFLLGFSLSPLLIGPIADRFGRRPVLLSMLLVFWFGSCLLLFSYQIITVYIARLTQGIASGGFFVVNQAMIRETMRGIRLPKVTSYVAIAWALVSVLAPLVGGYVETYYSWRMNFALISVYVSIILLAFLFVLPETIKEKSKTLRLSKVKQDIFCLLKEKRFISQALLASMTYGLIFIFYTISPALFEIHLHLTVVQYAWLLFWAGLAYLLGALNNSLACHYFFADSRIRFGLIGVALSVLFFVLGLFFDDASVPMLTAPLISMIFFAAFVFPNTLAVAMSTQENRLSTASAMYCSIQFFGCSLLSFISTRFSLTQLMPIALFMLFIVSCYPFVFREGKRGLAFNKGERW